MRTSASADRVMEAYYADVRHSDLLTAEEERILFKAYRSCTKCGYDFSVGLTLAKCPECHAVRDFKARDKLIQGALRFVVKVAKDYARRAKGFNYEDDLLKSLISAGNLGLLVAVDRFEPARQTRFLTYAAWWVREKIREELDNMGVIRVPAYRQKSLRAQRKTTGNVLEEAHVQVAEVNEIDQKHNDDRLERNLVNTYGVDLIHKALIELNFKGRDKYIVLAYFGAREEPKNLKQISVRLGISAERVRQIKRDVLDQLRTYLEGHSIAETFDVFTE